MKNCISKITVTDGKEFYWSNENTYKNMPPEVAAVVAQALQDVQKVVKEVVSPKAEGDLTVTLDATIDEVAQKPIVVSGMSRTELAKAQAKVYELGKDFIAHGMKRGKQKDDERKAKKK